MNIEAYLINNNVIINEKMIKQNSNLDPLKQVELIVRVHQILSNKSNTIIPRVNSTIGKELESFKIQVKKVSRNIKMIEENKDRDDIDIYFRDTAISILENAISCIEYIEDENYFNLIRRSMKNYEMCLGRVDENNLSIQEDGIINIKSIKYISYNLLEQDIFKYIKKIKRRELDISIDELINQFILKSNLGQESRIYLKKLEEYPLESMKMLSKYRILKNQDFIKNMERAWQIDYRK